MSITHSAVFGISIMDRNSAKVILYAGEVHFVKDDYRRVPAVARFVNRRQKVGFVVGLGEFVKVADKVASVAPAGLYGYYRGVAVENLAKA